MYTWRIDRERAPGLERDSVASNLSLQKGSLNFFVTAGNLIAIAIIWPLLRVAILALKEGPIYLCLGISLL